MKNWVTGALLLLVPFSGEGRPIYHASEPTKEGYTYISTYEADPKWAPEPVKYMDLGAGFVPNLPPGGTIICSDVLNGDTLKLASNDTVQLLGVDASQAAFLPRHVDHEQTALAYTTQMAKGKPLSFRFDQVARDKQQKLLAYAYLPDGTCLNALIIYHGHGYAHTTHPCKHLKRFQALEQAAREAKRGVWADRPQ